MSDKLTLNPSVPPPQAVNPTPVPATTSPAAPTPDSLEAQLNQAVSQLTAAPSLSFPTPPKNNEGNDFAAIEQAVSPPSMTESSFSPSSAPMENPINTADLAQTQVGGDPFGGQVPASAVQHIQETPTMGPAKNKSKSGSFLQSKIVIAAIAVVVLGGGAFATINYISNNGTNPIAPNAPASQPKAAETIPSKKPTAKAICGNGIVEAPETCDDSNIRNGDGCSSGCKKEIIPTATPAASLAPSATASSSAKDTDPLDASSSGDLGNLDDLAL